MGNKFVAIGTPRCVPSARLTPGDSDLPHLVSDIVSNLCTDDNPLVAGIHLQIVLDQLSDQVAVVIGIGKFIPEVRYVSHCHDSVFQPSERLSRKPIDQFQTILRRIASPRILHRPGMKDTVP